METIITIQTLNIGAMDKQTDNPNNILVLVPNLSGLGLKKIFEFRSFLAANSNILYILPGGSIKRYTEMPERCF